MRSVLIIALVFAVAVCPLGTQAQAQSTGQYQCDNASGEAHIVAACGARWEAANARAHALAGNVGDSTAECLQSYAAALDKIAVQSDTADVDMGQVQWPCGKRPAIASAADGVLAQFCGNAVWSYDNHGNAGCKFEDQPTFASLAWGSSMAVVRAALPRSSYRFVDSIQVPQGTGLFPSGLIVDRFVGTVFDHQTYVLARYTRENELAEIDLMLTRNGDSETDARNTFESVRAALSEKYGAPRISVRSPIATYRDDSTFGQKTRPDSDPVFGPYGIYDPYKTYCYYASAGELTLATMLGNSQFTAVHAMWGGSGSKCSYAHEFAFTTGYRIEDIVVVVEYYGRGYFERLRNEQQTPKAPSTSPL